MIIPQKKHNHQRGDQTDCRTEDGITISLIDTISFLMGQLSQRDLETPAAKEALLDLMSYGKGWPRKENAFSILISIKKA